MSAGSLPVVRLSAGQETVLGSPWSSPLPPRPPLWLRCHFRVISSSVFLLVDFIIWVVLGCLKRDCDSGHQGTQEKHLANFWFIFAWLYSLPEGADTGIFCSFFLAAHGVVLFLVDAHLPRWVHSSCALQSPPCTEASLPLGCLPPSGGRPVSVCTAFGSSPAFCNYKQSSTSDLGRTHLRVSSRNRGCWSAGKHAAVLLNLGPHVAGAQPCQQSATLGFSSCASLIDGNASQCGFHLLFSQKWNETFFSV